MFHSAALSEGVSRKAFRYPPEPCSEYRNFESSIKLNSLLQLLKFFIDD